MSPRPLVILGAGYTGRRIASLATHRGRPVFATSRTPEQHLHDIPSGQRLTFDLARPETWTAVPAGADVIWCFPAVPEEAVIAFAESVLTSTPRLVVLGSTSAYGPTATDDPVDESGSLDLTRPRVVGEETLRRRYRAVVLRLAGIYGPGRHVLDWIRQGKVTASTRTVNLVHVEDVAAVSLLALERGRPGEVYNVSDGRPRQWVEIAAEAHRRWHLPEPVLQRETGAGKRLAIDKLRREFHYAFRYPDLYAALDAIESATSTPSPSGPVD